MRPAQVLKEINELRFQDLFILKRSVMLTNLSYIKYRYDIFQKDRNSARHSIKLIIIAPLTALLVYTKSVIVSNDCRCTRNIIV